MVSILVDDVALSMVTGCGAAGVSGLGTGTGSTVIVVVVRVASSQVSSSGFFSDFSGTTGSVGLSKSPKIRKINLGKIVESKHGTGRLLIF